MAGSTRHRRDRRGGREHRGCRRGRRERRGGTGRYGRRLDRCSGGGRCGRDDRVRSRAGGACRRGGACCRGERRGRRSIRRSGGRVAGGNSGRQQAEWVDVALLVVGRTHPELDERLAHAGLRRRPDRPDAVALGDSRALADRDRAQARERHRPAVGGLDRQRMSADRHRARIRHDSRGRGADDGAELACHLDHAMLAGRIGMLRIERVRLEHGAVGRPRPRARGRRESERGDEDEQEAPHEQTSRVVLVENVIHRRDRPSALSIKVTVLSQ